jgi:hypothetical protein
VVAINGLPFDPNPSPFSDFFNQVQGKFRGVFSSMPHVPLPEIVGRLSEMKLKGKVSEPFTSVRLPEVVGRLVSKMQVKGKLTEAFSKIHKKRRKRKWDNLGKVVNVGIQEVKDLSERDTSVGNVVETNGIMASGSSDPI